MSHAENNGSFVNTCDKKKNQIRLNKKAINPVMNADGVFI